MRLVARGLHVERKRLSESSSAVALVSGLSRGYTRVAYALIGAEMTAIALQVVGRRMGSRPALLALLGCMLPMMQEADARIYNLCQLVGASFPAPSPVREAKSVSQS